MCRSVSSIFLGVVLAAALVAVGGCHHPGSDDWKFADFFDLHKGLPWHDDTPKPGVPVRVVGSWTDAVLRKDGQAPQRGFGGRLLFYGRDSKDPILVDGQLVVYAFDENGRDPTDNRPTRRYVFPIEQVPLHMSKSEVGTSYSFWLPWDEAGGPQTEVSLICRFEPKGGPVVVSEQTRHLLPGTMTPGTMLAGNCPPQLPDGVPSRPAVQQVPYSAENPGGGLAQTASYESQPVAGMGLPPESGRQMTTTSISLPGSFHLRGGAASVRGGPSVGDGQGKHETVTPSVSTRPATAPSPRTSSAWPAAATTLARPALPFTSPPPQVQTAGLPADPSWAAAQQISTNGFSTVSHTAATGQTAPFPGGLTTTVSYRFPGQPAPSPYPGQESSGLPPQTLPAQAAPGFPAPSAVIR
jgi:hypothetical protein